ncbi:MAG TPA: alpha/beta fold hydrolase, partial [Waddliaceae bacterium]
MAIDTNYSLPWNSPDKPGVSFKLSENADGGAIRIGDIAQKALIGLTIAALVAGTALLVAVVVLNPVGGMLALTVTGIALAILLSALALSWLPDVLPEPFDHVGNTIKTLVKEVFCLLTCAVLYPISQTWFDPKKEEINQNQNPVLLVHGYLHNSSAWTYYRYRLNKAGFNNVFTIDLGHPLQSIEDYAEKVKKKVSEIQILTGKSTITLIGHSMGGLVSSFYATKLASEQGIFVSEVVTLGSPLNGSRFSVIGFGECARQMGRESNFVKGLQEKVRASNIPFIHFGSQTDELVRPTVSAIIKDKEHFEF